MSRFRVDTKYWSASFDESEKDKAWEFYRSEEKAIRIVLCEDIFDEGVVLDGAPIVQDFTANECRINPVSSSVCERGTKCCIADHSCVLQKPGRLLN